MLFQTHWKPCKAPVRGRSMNHKGVHNIAALTCAQLFTHLQGWSFWLSLTRDNTTLPSAAGAGEGVSTGCGCCCRRPLVALWDSDAVWQARTSTTKQMWSGALGARICVTQPASR